MRKPRRHRAQKRSKEISLLSSIQRAQECPRGKSTGLGDRKKERKKLAKKALAKMCTIVTGRTSQGGHAAGEPGMLSMKERTLRRTLRREATKKKLRELFHKKCVVPET